MFPHPFQMALMGYWLSENQHRDVAQYAGRVEAYARRLERSLEEAVRERNQWAEYARDLENELRSTVEKLQNLDSAINRLMEKHRTLMRDAAKLKAFLKDFFGEHATKLLTPLGLKHRDMVLRFIQRLPDDPGDAPGP